MFTPGPEETSAEAVLTDVIPKGVAASNQRMKPTPFISHPLIFQQDLISHPAIPFLGIDLLLQSPPRHSHQRQIGVVNLHSSVHIRTQRTEGSVHVGGANHGVSVHLLSSPSFISQSCVVSTACWTVVIRDLPENVSSRQRFMRSSTSVKPVRTFFGLILCFPDTRSVMCNKGCNKGCNQGSGRHSLPALMLSEGHSHVAKPGHVFYLSAQKRFCRPSACFWMILKYNEDENGC